jgi:hypothetical protein
MGESSCEGLRTGQRERRDARCERPRAIGWALRARGAAVSRLRVNPARSDARATGAGDLALDEAAAASHASERAHREARDDIGGDGRTRPYLVDATLSTTR